LYPLCPEPTEKQAAMLMFQCLDLFYGGAGGGGKSWALLMAAAQFVDVPGYSALILRTERAAMDKAKGLIPTSRLWWESRGPSGPTFNQQKAIWTFPTTDPRRPATLEFGYLSAKGDLGQYKGPAYDFIGIDEASEFSEEFLIFLFTRLRRETGSVVPPRFRVATNPGGPGHSYLKRRYIDPHKVRDRITIRAYLEDNNKLDEDSYDRSLEEVKKKNNVLYRQIRRGDWDAVEGGNLFKPEFFTRFVHEIPPMIVGSCRYWDLAGTDAAKVKKGTDPDWTVGTLMVKTPSDTGIIHSVRDRMSPKRTMALMKAMAEADIQLLGSRDGYRVNWEEEGGSGGKFASSSVGDELDGFDYAPDKKTSAESKLARAKPYSKAFEEKKLWILRYEDPQHPEWDDWIPDFIDEHIQFPVGAHDDRVDSGSGAYHKLHNTDGFTEYYENIVRAELAARAAAKR